MLAKARSPFEPVSTMGFPLKTQHWKKRSFQAGQKEIYKTVCLSPAEIEALKELIGAECLQKFKLPTERKRNVTDLLARQ